MLRATKSELQMLREIGWLLLPTLPCYFCHKALVNRIQMTFGHRRHPPITVKLTVHHEDRDRDNNSDVNLHLCHSKCHRDYHANLRRMHEYDPTD